MNDDDPPSPHPLENTVDSLSSAFDTALSSLHGDADMLQMLQQARHILHNVSALAKQRRSGKSKAAPPPPAFDDDDVPMPPAPPPPAPPSRAPPPLLQWNAAATATLDPIEREERELEARRQMFALGAAEDFESLDWSTPAEGDDDIDGDGGSGAAEGDGAAEAAAAARVLDAVRNNSQREEDDEAPAEPTWEQRDGFVPPGQPGFNAGRSFVRKLLADINKYVRVSQEKRKKESAASKQKARNDL